MADPLVRCPPGHPCPNCGSTESVEALIEVLKGLRDERRRRAEEKQRSRAMQMATQAGVDVGTVPSLGNAVTIGGGSGGAGGDLLITGGRGGAGLACIGPSELHHAKIELTGFLTCVECGTKFADDHREQAEELREHIRTMRIEMDGAIGCLGDLVGG